MRPPETEESLAELIRACDNRSVLATLARAHDKLPGHSIMCRAFEQWCNGMPTPPCAVLSVVQAQQKVLDQCQAEKIRSMTAVELLEYMIEGSGWAVVYYGDEIEYPAIKERLAQLKAGT